MAIHSQNKLAILLRSNKEVLRKLSININRHYHPYRQPKKVPGEYRNIDNPDNQLKSIQHLIDINILRPIVALLPDYMHGARKGKSIITCAQPHIGAPALLTIDLKNCFPNISKNLIYAVYRQQVDCIPPVAHTLTTLTTYKHHLPQGAPTSPSLCNLVLAPLMAELHRLSVSYDLTFSQYIDDLFFSGNYQKLKQALPNIIDTIKKYGFKLSWHKIQINKNSQSIRMLGLIVNQKLSIGHTKKHTIERALLKARPNDDNKIAGWIAFCSMVNPNYGKHLKKRKAKTSSPKQMK